MDKQHFAMLKLNTDFRRIHFMQTEAIPLAFLLNQLNQYRALGMCKYIYSQLFINALTSTMF